MKKALLFAGTSEGRRLAEEMSSRNIEVQVCVATEYGEEVQTKQENITIHTGRLDQNQMQQLIREGGFDAVIDATHPYAVEVSKNIKEACEAVGQNYFRLLRDTGAKPQEPGEHPGDSSAIANEGHVHYVDTIEEAAAYLNQTRGNILLTTGSKELGEYVSRLDEISRLYVRILADGNTVEQCKKLGLTGKQIICMQGPFSAELNAAMLRQVDAKYLVTKETGNAGGFFEKLKGAASAEAGVVVIRKPLQEEGYSYEELKKELGLMQHPEGQTSRQQKRRVTLIGIGMGDPEGMTLEAEKAFRESDVILGARRMVEALAHFGKPTRAIYQPEKILSFLEEHTEYSHIAVAFSGDVGFYSGTGGLLADLDEETYEIRTVCGISSVVYMAAKMKMPWQDMKLASIHGRAQNIVGAVAEHPRVFTLVGSCRGVRELAGELLYYGYHDLNMHVGYQLSYPEEWIGSGTPEDYLDYDKEGLSVVVLENPRAKSHVVTHGMPDEAFVRGKAPMTKEEVRSISLSKLALTRDAVVYDVGAGTGSIGLECARQAVDGMVYAIERKPEALALLAENQKKLQVGNLSIVAGVAPEALEPLPAPTHAFIGGSSGNLNKIVRLLVEKNPSVRIVINAIALETVAEISKLLEEMEFEYTDIAQVSVAKAKTVGFYHMMMGQNPVYVVTLQNSEET